jgi:hypothetical protein
VKVFVFNCEALIYYRYHTFVAIQDPISGRRPGEVPYHFMQLHNIGLDCDANVFFRVFP